MENERMVVLFKSMGRATSARRVFCTAGFQKKTSVQTASPMRILAQLNRAHFAHFLSKKYVSKSTREWLVFFRRGVGTDP